MHDVVQTRSSVLRPAAATTPPFTPQDAEQFIRKLARDFTNAPSPGRRQPQRPNRRANAVNGRRVARLKQRDAGIRHQTIEEIRIRMCDSAPAAVCPAIGKRSLRNES